VISRRPVNSDVGLLSLDTAGGPLSNQLNVRITLANVTLNEAKVFIPAGSAD
jgi:hypothetical protein